VGYALEIIPKTLATNCGMDVVRIITELRAKHSEPGFANFGIDGNKKKINDMFAENVWEPIAVKNQVIKTSIEASCLLLRIDDVVSGVKRREKEKAAPSGQPEEPMETFGDQRDG
jgi:T-complex protein 1 subunit gamma